MAPSAAQHTIENGTMKTDVTPCLEPGKQQEVSSNAHITLAWKAKVLLGQGNEWGSILRRAEKKKQILIVGGLLPFSPSNWQQACTTQNEMIKE